MRARRACAPRRCASSKIWLVAALLAGIELPPISAFAINPTTTWTGGTSGDWSTSGNWNNGVPDATLTTNLSGAGGINQPTLSGTSAADTLNMNGTGNTLNLNGQTLSVGNALNLSAGTITNNAATGATLNVGTMTVTGGMLTAMGTGGSSFEIALSGGLTVNRADNMTIGNVISGAGGLIKSGTGTLTLSGANTYTGGTVLNAGTLTFGTDSVLPSGGALTLNGGTLDLNGTNQGVGAFSGSAGATVLFGSNFDTLNIVQSTNTTFAGNLVGSSGLNLGGVLLQGGGRLTLTGTATSVVLEADGGSALQIGIAGGAAGTVSGSILVTNDSSSTIDIVNGSIGDGAPLLPTGTVSLLTVGTTTFHNTTTAGNGVLLAADVGSIVFRDSASAANSTLLLLGPNASAVFLDQSRGSNATLASLGATVDFSGLTADTTVGALLGDGHFLLGSRTITVGGTGLTSAVDSDISGSGGLVKVGAGDFLLLGANTYTGPTTVSGGRFLVDGSITSSVTVNAGGTLGGSGTITGNVTNNGIIAPGSVPVRLSGPLAGFIFPDVIVPTGGPIGTLTITGNLSQGAGATYQVEVNRGQSDRLNVGGTATLGGRVTVSVAPALYGPSTTYTIVNATGGRSGSYSGVSTNLAFLAPSLSYDANNVFLTLSTNFAGGGTTPNQQAVGRALDQALASAGGDFANVLAALQQLDPFSGPKVLDVLAGTNYSGFSSLLVQASQLFMNSFSLHAGGGGGTTYQALKTDNCPPNANACEVEPLWGVWGGGVGAFGTLAGDANASGITYNMGGFAAGLDRRFAPNFRAGIATGFNAASLYSTGQPGTGTSNTLQFALYGELLEGPFYLDALAGYAHADNRMTRPLVIPGLPYRAAQGYTTANTLFGQLEAGYKLVIAPAFGGFVTPFARLQASTSTQNGFAESGADSLNLTVAAQTTNSLRTVLGAQFGATIDAPWRQKLNVTMRVGWSHEYADTTRPVSASFAGAPTPGFTTFGAAAPRDGAVVGLGANTEVAERTSVYLRYDGDLAGGNTSHVLSAGVRYVW